MKIIEDPAQLESFELHFEDLKKENPEAPISKLLERVVIEGRYSANTIHHGVDRLTKKGDYEPFTKPRLKNWLYHNAVPSVMRQHRVTKSELAKIIERSNRERLRAGQI